MSNHAAEYWASIHEKYGTGEPKRTFGEWSAVYWEDVRMGVPPGEAFLMFMGQTND